MRLILLVLSMYGYILYGNKKWKINAEFLPAILFSSIGCIIFISGILNMMVLTYGCLFAGGILLTAFYFIKRDIKIKEDFPFSLLFGFFFLFYLFWLLRDVRYIHYDNFSHWGLVIKNIFINSRLPNFSDTIISYQAYPTGSACFIWYICKAIGYSEGNTLFAQAILILSYAFPLFAFAGNTGQKKKYLISALVVFECFSWVTYGSQYANGLYQLLVDVLLAALAMAAFAMVYYYQNHVMQALYCVVPLLTFEICIKNSGIMWVFAILAELLYFAARSRCSKKDYFIIWAEALGIPYLFKVLWDKHVALVFPGGITTTHAMSAENYAKVFSEKSMEDLKNITSLFLEKTFSLKSTIILLILIVLIVLCALIITNVNTVKKIHMLFGFWFIVGVTIIYQSGNYVMYLLSMPLDEALRMAGYERYVMTLEYFLVGIISVYALNMIRQYQRDENILKRCSMILPCVLFAILLINKAAGIHDLWHYEEPQTGREASRIRMDEMVEKYQLEEGKKSLIYIGDPDKDRDVGYRYYMCKYVLYSRDIRTINDEQISELETAMEYDYVIILEHDDAVEHWLSNTSLPFINNECLKNTEVQ